MREYSNKIQLSKTYRGVWGLDTFKGCENGFNGGCYGICYAARLAKVRGYNFTKVIKREFINKEHFMKIVKRLKKIDFVRIGIMCDPSYDWKHTLDVVEKIKPYTDIVIITKHLRELDEEDLYRLKGVVVNTSICALDSKEDIEKRLLWYNKLKPYCKSVLRVNTAQFNNVYLHNIQNELLHNDNVIDNILRFPKNHVLVKQGGVVISKFKYLKSDIYASRYNHNTFFGFCINCPDNCGCVLRQKRITGWIA